MTKYDGDKKNIKVHTEAEIDAMAQFPPNFPECQMLCEDIANCEEELPRATGRLRWQLIARIRADFTRRRELSCGPCPPPPE